MWSKMRWSVRKQRIYKGTGMQGQRGRWEAGSLPAGWCVTRTDLTYSCTIRAVSDGIWPGGHADEGWHSVWGQTDRKDQTPSEGSDSHEGYSVWVKAPGWWELPQMVRMPAPCPTQWPKHTQGPSQMAQQITSRLRTHLLCMAKTMSMQVLKLKSSNMSLQHSSWKECQLHHSPNTDNFCNKIACMEYALTSIVVVAVQSISHIWLFGTPWLQRARLPCPSLSPWFCSNSCPMSQWCHPTISSSVAPFSCPQSFPASEFFPVSWFLHHVAKELLLQHQPFQWISRVDFL